MLLKKNRIYTKIIYYFGIVVIIAIFILSIILTIYFYQREKTRVLNENDKIIFSIENNIIGNLNNNKNTINFIYKNSSYINQLNFLLNNNLMNYSKFILDNFIISDSFEPYISITDYLEERIEANKYLDSVFIFSNYNNNAFKIKSKENITKINPNILQSLTNNDIDNFSFVFPYDNSILQNLTLNDSKELYTFTYRLKDPISLEDIGYISFNYNRLEYADLLYHYKDSKKMHVQISSKNSDIIYDSLGKTTALIPKSTSIQNQELLKIDNNFYKIKFESNTSIYIATKIAKLELIKNILDDIFLIFGISIFLILSIIYFTNMIISRFSVRTNNIITAIKQVADGELKTKIPIGNNMDELDLIATNFNKMIDNVNQHIKLEYLATIKQKDAQMLALQSQINPHMLYNTLEVIRMKALSQNSTELAHMIYLLSMIFRKKADKKFIVTINEEIELCKLYLELNEMRYPNHFRYNIEVDPSLQTASIIHLTLQPIIENYFVHGIDLDKEDNFIELTASISNGIIQISICDNGRGIDKKKLDIIKDNLKHYTINQSNSLGLVSVHERFKIVYGEDYGLSIDSTQTEGTTITISYPKTKRG